MPFLSAIWVSDTAPWIFTPSKYHWYAYAPLADSFRVPFSHMNELPGEAMAPFGKGRFVSTRSSKEAGQLPLVIVQRRTAMVPVGIPVAEVDAEEGVAMTAVPLTTDHTPVPIEGALPLKEKLPLLHLASSGPALEGVGGA